MPYPELLDLGLDVALGEVLDVGQLEVHLSQPHQDAVAGRLKLLPLADEVLKVKGGAAGGVRHGPVPPSRFDSTESRLNAGHDDDRETLSP